MASKQRLVFLLAVAACFLLLLPSHSAAVSFENCKGRKDYPVKVSGVEIKPDLIIRGVPAIFKISASTARRSLFLWCGAMEASGDQPPAPRTVPAAEKRSWPELVGVSSEEARRKVEEDKPGASVHVVPADAFVTMDYNTGRVRIFVDSNDKVARAPRIG